MMPSPRIFRSRWSALLWAGGIVWMAVDVADSAPAPAPAKTASTAKATTPTPPPASDDGDTPDAADVKALANFIDG